MKYPFVIFQMFVLFGCHEIPEQDFSNLDTLVQEELGQKNIPGMAVGIVHRGKVVLARGYGYARVESGDTVSDQTIFQLGSVTKTFTGHLLAKYVADELLDLQTPLSTLYPDSVRIPEGRNGEQITVAHIATHSASFPRYPANLGRVDPDPIRGYSIPALHSGIRLVELDTFPGVQYYYSNFGYGVLGTALENLNNQALAEQMDHHIFEPLEMTSSALIINGIDQKRLAQPYLEVDPLTHTEPWDMGSLRGAGNLFSNVADLNRFMMHLLKDTDVNRIQQEPRLSISDTWNYGLGCFITQDTTTNTYFVHHGGDIDGYASQLTIFPDYELGVVTLTNWGSGRGVGPIFNAIRDWALEWVLDKSDTE